MFQNIIIIIIIAILSKMFGSSLVEHQVAIDHVEQQSDMAPHFRVGWGRWELFLKNWVGESENLMFSFIKPLEEKHVLHLQAKLEVYAPSLLLNTIPKYLELIAEPPAYGYIPYLVNEKHEILVIKLFLHF